MTTALRFVHAADLHLDAPFKGVDAADPRVRDTLVGATIDALKTVVDTSLERDAAFVVLAGDVYDASDRSLRAELAFRKACERLDEAGIRVFVARGNHDPMAGRPGLLSMPPNVHVFSCDEVERVVVDNDGEPVCAVYGRSFRKAAEKQNLARGFSRRPDDPFAIGVLHTNVGGRPGHEPYAPCSTDDLLAAKMDYWALGHIHKAEVLCEDPPIVYSGSTQGLHAGEQGFHGCSVVTLDSSGATVERVSTARVAWASLSIGLEQASTIDDVREAIIEQMGHAVGREGIPVILRLELTGRSEVHSELIRPGVLADLSKEVREAGMSKDPWAWIDRLADRTRPVIDLDAIRAGSDLAADLVREADRLLGDQDALDSCLEEIAAPVLRRLSARDGVTFDPRDVVTRARDLALDRLLAEEDK